MKRLDPHELRAYAARDWGAPARLARRERARMSVERKIQLAIDLYEAAKAACPGWPTTRDRQADYASHVRVRALLEAAAHVGAR